MLSSGAEIVAFFAANAVVARAKTMTRASSKLASFFVCFIVLFSFLLLGVSDNRDAAHQEDTESSFLRLVW